MSEHSVLLAVQRQVEGLVAERDAYREALLHVRQILAAGRTVGNDHTAAALAAENYIIELLQVQ